MVPFTNWGATTERGRWWMGFACCHQQRTIAKAGCMPYRFCEHQDCPRSKDQIEKGIWFFLWPSKMNWKLPNIRSCLYYCCCCRCLPLMMKVTRTTHVMDSCEQSGVFQKVGVAQRANAWNYFAHFESKSWWESFQLIHAFLFCYFSRSSTLTDDEFFRGATSSREGWRPFLHSLSACAISDSRLRTRKAQWLPLWHQRNADFSHGHPIPATKTDHFC